ncbi:hypothetical protein [Luteibacter sp. E-22]
MAKKSLGMNDIASAMPIDAIPAIKIVILALRGKWRDSAFKMCTPKVAAI